MIAVVLVDGVFLGAMLCLASLGLSLTYAVFRFPNFAHAGLLGVGAYGAWLGYGWDGPWMAGMVAIAAVTCAALLADRLVFRALLARGGAGVIIAAFAVGLLLREALVLVFGPGEIAAERPLEIAAPVWGAARLTGTEQGVIVAAVLGMAVLQGVLRWTPLGRALRALAENPALAGVVGVAIPGVRRAAWALCGVFAGLAGLAMLLLGPVRPDSGAEFLLPALAAVILGGLGSIGGTLAGALLIGLVESACVHLGFAEWRQVASFAVIVLVLILRPRGLAG